MATIGLLLGPLPRARTTRRVARLMHEAASSSTRLVELDLTAVPHHAPYTDVPAGATALAWKRAVADLDGLLVLTPAHERSVPGALKNALDWAGGAVAPNALAGLPVVIAGVCEGQAPRFSAIQHLRAVLADSGAHLKSQPEITLTIAPDSFGEDDACGDDALTVGARELLSIAAGFVAHQSRTGIEREARTLPDALEPDVLVPDILEAATGPRSAVDGVPVVDEVRAPAP
ncbi:NADPH-dependent FMN reductase [Demequina activiva]|uniref:NADPH-dependent FMN reductase-like domain-containing protein n=1 Tax=Demequina activiva TaxID=1582364 RepID=A0A919Q376_9MICO|nr:NAD(P)H-dependent oxidoreductase [Demequina activiva]GIG55204.1 hypothetical protein Dac01nite_19560 [Demequina activiva]